MSLAIAAIAGPAPAVPTRAGASAGGFALSLAQVAGGADGGSESPPTDTGAKAKTKDDATRQDDAAGGSALPPALSPLPDPALLAPWLPSSPLTPVPLPVATDKAAPTVTAPVLAAANDAAAGYATLPTRLAEAAAIAPVANGAAAALAAAPPLPAPVVPATTMAAASAPPLPMLAPVGAAPATVPPIVPQLAATALAALAGPVALTGVTIGAPPSTAPIPPKPAPDPTPTMSALQIDPRAAPVVALPPAPIPTLPQPGAPAAAVTSAIQAFGAAIRAGLGKDTGDPAAAPPAPLATGGAAAAPAIAATGDAQQAPLDLRRQDWPHAMIDRIEALRDAADAASTRIRVVPDALGPVEVALRKDGDTLHVHFTADQAQTRALLLDAQPRLAAIAEQRGLRLGGSSVDAGTGQQQQQQQRASAPPPAAPPSSTSVAADAAADDDTRLA